MNFGNLVGSVLGTVLPGVGSLIGNALGGNNSGLGQEQQMMQQAEQQQMQMFQLQQQATAFGDKMQTLAAIEARMDQVVQAMAQDMR